LARVLNISLTSHYNTRLMEERVFITVCATKRAVVSRVLMLCALCAATALLVLAGTVVPAGHAFAASSDAPAVTADAYRLSGDTRRTRLVFDLSDAVPVRAFALADPYRVIVDVPGVGFRLPGDAGRKGRGLVSGFRYGLFAPGQSRIVIDVNRPVLIDGTFVLRPQDGKPARLVVDLTATDAETFERRAATANTAPEWPQANRASKGARLGVAVAANRKPVIVIDPGHGGVDPGAIGKGGTREKDVVLAFANELHDVLEAKGGYDLRMTRDSDFFVSLGDRVRIAREEGAALFISIHADSFRGGSVRGATVYTLAERASDEDAAQLAIRENKSDLFAGLQVIEDENPVTDILVDLVRRETKNLSIVLAKALITEIGTTTRLNKNPHRFAGFRVLQAPDVPSVLVELGYLSNRNDEKRLKDPVWREKTAQAMAQAIARFARPQVAANGVRVAN